MQLLNAVNFWLHYYIKMHFIKIKSTTLWEIFFARSNNWRFKSSYWLDLDVTMSHFDFLYYLIFYKYLNDCFLWRGCFQSTNLTSLNFFGSNFKAVYTYLSLPYVSLQYFSLLFLSRNFFQSTIFESTLFWFLSLKENCFSRTYLSLQLG